MVTPAVFLAGIVLAAALYCGLDPLGRSPMANFPGFETYPYELPPWSEVPHVRDEGDRLRGAEVRFLNQVKGPESIAFDPQGRGPYTGVDDGRVVFWNGESWSDFAYTSLNRTEICSPDPNPFSHIKIEHICGRPLGLRFDKKTGDLYIADAYFGLLKVGPQGGIAATLTAEAEGVPLGFTNDLAIDDEGTVYFTDSSAYYQRRNFLQLIFTGESSGRLLKYNPTTKVTTVLLRDLQFPNGVTLSKDESFLLFSEARLRLTKYWLKGEKAGTSEVFAILPGYADNVRTNENGDFWVAIHCHHNKYIDFLSKHRYLRKLLLKLPISIKYTYLLLIGGKLHGVVVKYSPNGEIIETLEDREGKTVKAISEVEEKDGKLWLGSVLMPFIAVY
ncbi:protein STRICTOSIDINE SYNTHASE-LIKE 3-like [Zingiber officinale]|uniref:protein STRICTOSIDINE SYNTHASE-LIKE 3-like n=1 Tax=Zingiber officinale TaxID=94328 RepID=UPI001C4BE90F|nr:protein STRICTOSIDINE SYNTHASE-LIKE 3-like [Zingiber officinale]